jgi:Protein of unknown function (DUF2845)
MRVVAIAVCGGILVGALAVTATAAHADGGTGGFRCGSGRVIRDGETEDDVSTKCGAPDAVRTWTETRRERVWQGDHAIEREVSILYDEWKYDLGRDRLIRYVTFEQGRLVRVRTGPYGNTPNQ